MAFAAGAIALILFVNHLRQTDKKRKAASNG